MGFCNGTNKPCTILPASKVILSNWKQKSKIYLIFTSYKLLAAGQSCRGELHISLHRADSTGQTGRSTSVRQTRSSSRQTGGCACHSAWRVTAYPTAGKTLFPTQTRLASRHQLEHRLAAKLFIPLFSMCLVVTGPGWVDV